MSNTAEQENLSFEETLARLEKVITGMEKADLPLDKLMEAYSEGIALEKSARRKLADMRKKIEVLAGKSTDAWQDFDGGSNRIHGEDII